MFLDVVVPALMVVLLFVGVVASVIAFAMSGRRREEVDTQEEYVPVAPVAQRYPQRITQEDIDRGGPLPLPIEVWLTRVNKEPDRVPHLAATGYTGSGKTTLVTGVIATRPGKVVVFTPKKDDFWGGLPFVSIDDDLSFRSIARGLDAVYNELKRRNISGAQEWLTVVIDDYPWVAKECPRAAEIVTIVGNMGRSVRVRLILLAQQKTVKAWGFEGNGEARANFVFLDLEEDHTAVIYRWGKQPESIDTRHVLRLSKLPIGPERAWAIPQGTDPVQDSQPTLSAQHIRVASWLTQDPAISDREIARRLYPGTDGGGRYCVNAKAIRDQVEAVLREGVTLLQTAGNRPREHVTA